MFDLIRSHGVNRNLPFLAFWFHKSGGRHTDGASGTTRLVQPIGALKSDNEDVISSNTYSSVLLAPFG